MTRKDPLDDFEDIVVRLAYPTTKAEILDAVRTHGTTNSAVEIAQRLPSITYNSSTEVLENVRRTEE